MKKYFRSGADSEADSATPAMRRHARRLGWCQVKNSAARILGCACTETRRVAGTVALSDRHATATGMASASLPFRSKTLLRTCRVISCL